MRQAADVIYMAVGEDGRGDVGGPEAKEGELARQSTVVAVVDEVTKAGQAVTLGDGGI